MEKEYIIRRIAGSMIIVGVVLAYLVSIYWLLLPLFCWYQFIAIIVYEVLPFRFISKRKNNTRKCPEYSL